MFSKSAVDVNVQINFSLKLNYGGITKLFLLKTGLIGSIMNCLFQRHFPHVIVLF